MSRLLPYLAGWAVGLAVAAAAEPPPAPAANPTLKIRAWQGSPEVRARLQQDLLYADWLTLTEGDADYYLEGVAIPPETPGAAATLSLTLLHGRDQQQLRQQDADPAWLAHRAADQVLKATCGTGGFCATQLAFVRAEGQTKEVWVSDFDGSNARQLTHNRSLSTEPAWGGANRYLTYTLYRQAATDIVMLDLLQKRHKLLASYRGLNAGCILSPDGLQAAMCLSKDGRVDLFVKDLSTDQVRPLTADEAVEASPCWSPDGQYVCFVSNRQQRPALYLVPAAGGEAKPLAAPLTDVASPDWSPVSNKLCFTLVKGPDSVIAELDLKAPNPALRILTNAAGEWEAPSWCADGRHLVCTRTFEGRSRLFLVDSWHGKLRELPAGDGVSLPACSARY